MPSPISTPVETVTVTPTLPSTVESASPAASTTEPPAWPWWLLGAVLIAVAVGIALMLAARRRRNSWNAQLLSAIGEITWLARQLIPQLQQSGSREQLAGAWQVTRDRVSKLEDTMSGLQSTAPNEQEVGRVRDLRDAVRDARTRIDLATEMTGPSIDTTTTSFELGEARATLETALANSEPGRRSADGDSGR
jgi:hypothetical protein